MLNTKSERKGYKIARLTVEKTAFEHLKKIEDDEVANSKLNHEMLLVKEWCWHTGCLKNLLTKLTLSIVPENVNLLKWTNQVLRPTLWTNQAL